MNREDGRNRHFVLVQLPEPLDENEKTQKAAAEFCKKLGVPQNIAAITKERVRRAIQNQKEGEAGHLDLGDRNGPDLGFRVFCLAESNLKPWIAEAPEDAKGLATQLELHVNHILGGRTADDLLYELLLKSGFPLTTPVEVLQLAEKAVHSVASGALLVCLDRELTLELVRAMAERKPERIVCLDEGFAGNDQLKANAVQIFKTKGVTSFKTV
jgi:adenine-specific DNA-methyltransferase